MTYGMQLVNFVIGIMNNSRDNSNGSMFFQRRIIRTSYRSLLGRARRVQVNMNDSI